MKATTKTSRATCKVISQQYSPSMSLRPAATRLNTSEHESGSRIEHSDASLTQARNGIPMAGSKPDRQSKLASPTTICPFSQMGRCHQRSEIEAWLERVGTGMRYSGRDTHLAEIIRRCENTLAEQSHRIVNGKQCASTEALAGIGDQFMKSQEDEVDDGHLSRAISRLHLVEVQNSAKASKRVSVKQIGNHRMSFR